MQFNATYIIFFISLFLLLLTEFIVFNEELLLTLCFLSFVFCFRNLLQQSFHSFFIDHALKIENDIIVAFAAKQLAISSFLTNVVITKLFLANSLCLVYLLTHFVSCFFSFQSVSRSAIISSLVKSSVSSWLENAQMITNLLEKSNIQLLYFPMVFKLIAKQNKIKIGVF
jgi:hypothetical protein